MVFCWIESCQAFATVLSDFLEFLVPGFVMSIFVTEQGWGGLNLLELLVHGLASHFLTGWGNPFDSPITRLSIVMSLRCRILAALKRWAAGGLEWEPILKSQGIKAK
jgi:hypothetical protein